MVRRLFTLWLYLCLLLLLGWASSAPAQSI